MTPCESELSYCWWERAFRLQFLLSNFTFLLFMRPSGSLERMVRSFFHASFQVNPPDAPGKGDLETAEMYGRRVAEITLQFVRPHERTNAIVSFWPRPCDLIHIFGLVG